MVPSLKSEDRAARGIVAKHFALINFMDLVDVLERFFRLGCYRYSFSIPRKSRRGFRESSGNFHVRNKTISRDIRTAIGGLGKWRPYDLRHFFLTWLRLAVARNVCSEGYRIYWAGQRELTTSLQPLRNI